jgi:hypothetical protein
MSISARTTLGEAIAIALALVIACGDDEAPSPTPSSLASESATPSPAATPTFPAAYLLFIRGTEEVGFPYLGELWMSDIDGNNERRITPEGVAAVAISPRRNEGGGAVIYFITKDGESERSLVRFDVDSETRDTVLSYTDALGRFYGDVSPNGQYYVHTQPLGLELYNIRDHTSRTLFASGHGATCQSVSIDECYNSWIAPAWSWDNSLLLTTHAVYEGGWVEVIDPHESPPLVLTEGSRGGPSQGEWSPRGTAVCAYGQYANTSSLYVLESPEWEARRATEELEDYTKNPDGRGVVDCGWLGEDNVLYLSVRQHPSVRGELFLLRRGSGETRLITELQDVTGCCAGKLLAAPDMSVAVTQFLDSDQDYFWTQPAVVDLVTGDITHVLEKGDILVGAFTDYD